MQWTMMHGRQRREQTLIFFVGWVDAAVLGDWTLENHLQLRAGFCHFGIVLLSLSRTLYKMCSAYQ